MPPPPKSLRKRAWREAPGAKRLARSAPLEKNPAARPGDCKGHNVPGAQCCAPGTTSNSFSQTSRYCLRNMRRTQKYRHHPKKEKENRLLLWSGSDVDDSRVLRADGTAGREIRLSAGTGGVGRPHTHTSGPTSIDRRVGVVLRPIDSAVGERDVSPMSAHRHRRMPS